MIGNRVQDGQGSFAPKDLPGNIPGAVLYERIVAHPYQVEAFWQGAIHASASTGGRGQLKVSNKASEVNILNMPVVFVVKHEPLAQHSRYVPRLLSHNIPVPSSM